MFVTATIFLLDKRLRQCRNDLEVFEAHLDDLEALGSAFLAMRLSESSLSPNMRAPFGVPTEKAEPRQQASTSAAHTLLTARSNVGASLRLARWGAAIVKSACAPETSRTLGNMLLREFDAAFDLAPRHADGRIIPSCILKPVLGWDMRLYFPLDLS